MRYLFSILFALVLVLPLHAQKEGNIWYFGNKAGIDFNSGKPISLTNGKIQTIEGCASICDRFGHLLFYTDGITVYDRKHSVMKNGTGLFGDQSTTQAALIIPYVGDTNLYYIFTLDKEARVNGLCYSLVDMRLNKGYGDVYQKNIAVYSPSTEKMTAVVCSDKSGYWLITHNYGNNQFIVYKISSTGIATSPVVSKVGSNSTAPIGYMNASPDGKKLALSNYQMYDVELFDFDNATGKVSNAVKINSYYNNYGLAFSPDSKLLYTCQCVPSGPVKNLIQQYDLTASNIAASAYLLNTDTSLRGAMALGPDGRIYVAKLASNYLDVINDPDERGVKCGYVSEGLKMVSGYSTYGLPNFPIAIYPKNKITYTIGCNGDPVIFRRISYSDADSILWNFGDPASAASNTSNADSIGHVYLKSGTYRVVLYSFFQGSTDTESVSITIGPTPSISLPKNPTICKGNELQLKIKKPFYPVTWSDGSNDSIFITNSGKYWVTAWLNTCPQSDTVNVTVLDLNDSTGLDTTICQGDSVKIDLTKPGRSYVWEDKNTSARRTFNITGKYYVTIYNQCRIQTDTFRINVNRPLYFDLGKDTVLCQGTKYNLIGPDSADLLWQDGTISTSYTVTNEGVYKLIAMNVCGSMSDSVHISYYPVLNEPRAIDTILCLGNSLAVDVKQSSCHYSWQDGDTNAVKIFNSAASTYVKIFNACTFIRDSINIRLERPPLLRLGIDTVLCRGESLTLNAPDSTDNTWQDGSKAPVFKVTNAGLYWLKASNICGSASDSIHVKYDNKYISHLPKDTFVCIGDSIKVDAGSISGTYLWSDGVKGSVRTMKASGQYLLNFKNACEKVEDTINLKTDSFCTCNLYTPDIFTPDGNGINDVWKPSLCTHYHSYYLQIFDRWGECIFKTDDLNKGWDGQFHGSQAMDGMYHFLIKVKDAHYTESYKSGRFYLIRN